MKRTLAATPSALLAPTTFASPSDESLTDENAPFPTGKTDGGIDEGSPEALAVLALVNDPSVDLDGMLIEAFDLRRRGAIVFIGDLSDQLLEDILDRDEPGRAAVFVQHYGHVHLLLLKRAKEIADQLGFGDEIGPSHRRAQVEG